MVKGGGGWGWWVATPTSSIPWIWHWKLKLAHLLIWDLSIISKKISAVINQLNVNKVEMTNRFCYSVKTTNRPEAHLNFELILNLMKCCGVKPSKKPQSSNMLELILERLKQTVTMSCLRFHEKRENKKIRENWEQWLSSRHILSAYFLCENSLWVFFPVLDSAEGVLPFSFLKIIAFS